jgi:hypothetical protein
MDCKPVFRRQAQYTEIVNANNTVHEKEQLKGTHTKANASAIAAKRVTC